MFIFIFWFVSQYNYGGIQAKFQDGSEDVESQVEIVSSWNIADNLPKSTQVNYPPIIELFSVVRDLT